MGRRLRATLLLTLSACTTRWDDHGEGDLVHLVSEAHSWTTGRVTIEVPVESGQDALLLTVVPESGYRAIVQSVVTPDRDEVFDVEEEWASGRLKTGARYATDVLSINWPILAGDAPLVDGNWRVTLGVVDDESMYRPGIDVDLDCVIKHDPTFDDGVLTARMVLSGSIRTDTEAQRALEQAKLIWADLYGQVGISLEFIDGTTDETNLEMPGFGSEAAYASISSETAVGDVTVVIAPTIEGSPDIYGVAGGIPGPLVSSSRSAVTVSALTHAGGDMLFSPTEERVLAETLAHEVGHYLGLFHPVETDWDLWDAIDDTPECENQSQCISQLGTNVMFPFPVCSQTACQAQDDLTTLQGAAMNRYVGVR